MKKYLRIGTFLRGHGFHSLCDFVKLKFGNFYLPYIMSLIHKDDRNFYDKPPYNRNKNISVCLYDDEEKLNNWKYYVFNNKLPLFIGCCIILQPSNKIPEYVPYITDKRYTDEEIYDKLKFTH